MKRKEIIELLHRIEEREEIEILYACEAGSRALGFANDDSNHDIRFIYKKPNVKDYLSLEEPSDMIECVGDDLDFIGWDIRKALMLHYKSDSTLRECFISSLVYIDKGIESIFSGLGGFDIDFLKNDYASIAHNRWKMYCTLEFGKEKSKKYLYVVRSILCWMLLNRDIYPPIDILELVNHDFINLDDGVRQAINDLIDFHQNNGDLSERTVFILNSFILDSLSMMKNTKTKSHKQLEDYDERFRELLLVCR